MLRLAGRKALSKSLPRTLARIEQEDETAA
jgi:hypothetical protein